MIITQYTKSIKTLSLAICFMSIYSCNGQEPSHSTRERIIIPKSKEAADLTNESQTKKYNRSTIFPQVHSNLNGMVSEFVRTMYQDTKGNLWFGTNGNGLIRYDGKTLKEFTKEDGLGTAVRAIVEDKKGNVWFGTSSGLVKYDGTSFTNVSKSNKIMDHEIWSMAIVKNNTIWVGSVRGLHQLNGDKLEAIAVPKGSIVNADPMLSEDRICDIIEDKKGDIWLAIDGYGITTYSGTDNTFYNKINGLTDNNVADLLEDSKGNIWIGTFYGGVSRYDGTTYTNYTMDGIIEGIETYNLFEDHYGNIWFSAENQGVYRFDGSKFTQFKEKDGLATNGVQCIYEDNKNQMWFGTWAGLSIYDGAVILDAENLEPWVK